MYIKITHFKDFSNFTLTLKNSYHSDIKTNKEIVTFLLKPQFCYRKCVLILIRLIWSSTNNLIKSKFPY